MSYGATVADAVHQAGIYAGKILSGAKAALEVNVNALGTSGFELFCKIGCAMIDTSIEAQLAGDDVALLSATSDPDRMASFDFRDLPDHRPDGARGRRNNDSLPRLRLSPGACLLDA